MCPLALPDGPISQPSVMVVLLTSSCPPVSHASPRVSGKQPRQKSAMPLPVTVTTPVAMVICPCENESKPNTMALAVQVPLETSTWPRPVWPTYVVPFVVRIEPPPRNVIRPLTNGLAPSSESTCNRELLTSRNPPVSTTKELRMRSGVALPAVAIRSVLVELPGADNVRLLMVSVLAVVLVSIVTVLERAFVMKLAALELVGAPADQFAPVSHLPLAPIQRLVVSA